MSNIREQIYLAALIHDIGFFYQKVASIDIADETSLTKKRIINLVLMGRITQAQRSGLLKTLNKFSINS